MIFGKKTKELREEYGLLQRQLPAALEMDTPMYSKIERGERKANLVYNIFRYVQIVNFHPQFITCKG